MRNLQKARAQSAAGTVDCLGTYLDTGSGAARTGELGVSYTDLQLWIVHTHNTVHAYPASAPPMRPAIAGHFDILSFIPKKAPSRPDIANNDDSQLI